jgi:hypothetical protein
MRRLSQVLCKNRLYQFMPHQLTRRVVLLKPLHDRWHILLKPTGDEEAGHTSSLAGRIFINRGLSWRGFSRRLLFRHRPTYSRS